MSGSGSLLYWIGLGKKVSACTRVLTRSCIKNSLAFQSEIAGSHAFKLLYFYLLNKLKVVFFIKNI